ncbi:MAG: hypothetical protein M3541_04960 [Acidobacteriota bacterium]|nr:hypothetical protein [Acidobacteriota bacterium]MDQ3418118.1 hypothetical protein [Acidobacteriota bacterium]
MKVLIAVYIAKQLLTVFVFPPFTGHDEVAHFQYVRVLATDRVPERLYFYDYWMWYWQQRHRGPYDPAWRPNTTRADSTSCSNAITSTPTPSVR